MLTNTEVKDLLVRTIGHKSEKTKILINTQHKKLSLVKHFLKRYGLLSDTAKLRYISFVFKTDLLVPFSDYTRMVHERNQTPNERAFSVLLLNSFNPKLETFDIPDRTINAVFDDGMLETWLRAQSISWETVNDATDINFKNILKATLWLRYGWILKTTQVERILRGTEYVGGEYRLKSPLEMSYGLGASASVYWDGPTDIDKDRWLNITKLNVQWQDDAMVDALVRVLKHVHSKDRRAFNEKCIELQAEWIQKESLDGIEDKAFVIENVGVKLTALIADYHSRNNFTLDFPLLRLNDENGFMGITPDTILAQIPQANVNEKNKILAGLFLEASLSFNTGANMLADHLRMRGLVDEHSRLVNKLGTTGTRENIIGMMFLLCLDLRSRVN